jgi:hypothetical protein
MVFDFYYHFKKEEKLTVMFSLEVSTGEAVGTEFFTKRGGTGHELRESTRIFEPGICHGGTEALRGV